MENKITAVQWLIQQIKSDQNQKALSPSEWMQIFEQAKAMEKQQHDNTWIDSSIEQPGEDYIGPVKTFEQYYTETYTND